MHNITKFNLQQFLKRIQINQQKPSKEYLFNIVSQCYYNIPFENLDIVQRKPITLNTEKCYEKIVLNKRGGLCYEINGLLYTSLKELGFSIIPVQGQVKSPLTGQFGEIFDHLLCVVEFENEEKYIVDVGFGDFYRLPIPFQLNKEFTDITGKFKLEKLESEEGFYIVKMQKPKHEEFKEVYKFDLLERKLEDFEDFCQKQFYNQEWFFNKTALCLIAIPEGWHVLTSKRFSVIKNQDREDTEIQSSEQFNEYLNKYFNIQIPDLKI